MRVGNVHEPKTPKVPTFGKRSKLYQLLSISYYLTKYHKVGKEVSISMYKLDIHKSVKGFYNIIQSHLHFKTKKRKDKYKWLVNDKKLENNLSRARSAIFNICSYNDFGYFYTQTIDSIYDRTNVKWLISKINGIIRDLRKRDKSLNLYYLVVPEHHKDGKSFHVHGFLSKDFERYIYINDNGFGSVSFLDKIGYNSVEKINNYEGAIRYATKYITKDLLCSAEKGERVFYCSQKLIRSNLINSLVLEQIAPIHFDYKSEYVFKTSVNESKYYNMITSLDSSKIMFYDNNC